MQYPTHLSKLSAVAGVVDSLNVLVLAGITLLFTVGFMNVDAEDTFTDVAAVKAVVTAAVVTEHTLRGKFN